MIKSGYGKSKEKDMFQRCKITVIKKELNTYLSETYAQFPEKIQKCEKVSEGQEFIISNPFELPEGMCASAWSDIRQYIFAVCTGSRFDFMKNEHSILAGCTDLFRPVIFKIERIRKG